MVDVQIMSGFSSHLQKFHVKHHFREHIKENPRKKKTLKRGKKFVVMHHHIIFSPRLKLANRQQLNHMQHYFQQYKPHQRHKWPCPVLPKELEGWVSFSRQAQGLV